MENGKHKTFHEFYREWREEQKQQLHHLVVASKADSSSSASSLSVLVASVLAHYEHYYTVKSRCAKTNVLLLLSPPWITQLEDAFIWVGGWRPTTAFHLLISKSGLQFEAKFSAMDSGAAIPLDLGDLSSDQLVMIDKLQRSTIAEERRITEKAAKQQERVAETEMVKLSQIASESTRVDALDIGQVKSTLKAKEEGFQKILQTADDLRLGTLKGVVEILSPIQAVHFLIAAGELLLRLHDWGREKEESEAGSEAVL